MISSKPAKVSIIVPIYNVELYIEECIESILAQTMEEIEIVLVDDGSTDKCSSICDEYAQRDARIKVIHKKNGGLVSARKAGVIAAGGEYICYVDGDDCIEAEMCEKVYKEAKYGNYDIVAFGFQIKQNGYDKTISNGIKSGEYTGREKKNIRGKMLCESYFKWGVLPSVWTKMFKREVLIEAQMNVPNEINIGEDVACTYLAIERCKSLYVMNNYFPYHYRYVDDSMSHRWKPDYFIRIGKLFDYLYYAFQDEEMKLQIDIYRIFLLNQGLIQLWKSNQDKEEKINFLKNLYHEYTWLFVSPKCKMPLVIEGELFIINKQYFSLLSPLIKIIKNI